MATKRRHQDGNCGCQASALGIVTASGELLRLPAVAMSVGDAAELTGLSSCGRSTNLYLRGLLPSDTDETVRRIVTECCPASLCERINSTKAVMDDRSGLCKGYGFVDFLDQGQAAEAMEAIVKAAPRSGRLQVSFARPKEETEKDPTNVYIKNLPTRAECNEDWLAYALGQELVGTVTGRIVSCRVMRASESAPGSGASSGPVTIRVGSNGATGAGFIRFETERDALAAVAYINRNGAALAQQLGAARPMEAKLADKTNQRRRQRAAAMAAAAAAAAAAVAAAAAGVSQSSSLSALAQFPSLMTSVPYQQQQQQQQHQLLPPPPPTLSQLPAQPQAALAGLVYGQQPLQQVPGLNVRMQPAVSLPSYVLTNSNLLGANPSMRTSWPVGGYDAGAAATAAAAAAAAATALYSPASSQIQANQQQQRQQQQLQHYLQQPGAFADLTAGVSPASAFYPQQLLCDPTAASHAFHAAAAAAGIFQQQLLMTSSSADQQQQQQQQ